MQRPSFLLSNQRITLTVLGDHASLSCLLSSIPKIGDPEHIRTESNSPSQKRVAEDDDRLIGGAEQKSGVGIQRDWMAEEMVWGCKLRGVVSSFAHCTCGVSTMAKELRFGTSFGEVVQNPDELELP
ncbi:hypothetical protein Bca4012_046561 [Brassica carinata]